MRPEVVIGPPTDRFLESTHVLPRQAEHLRFLVRALARVDRIGKPRPMGSVLLPLDRSEYDRGTGPDGDLRGPLRGRSGSSEKIDEDACFTGILIGDDRDSASLPGVKIDIIMGRHAGWLTAAAALGRRDEADGPHLIYIPERKVSEEKMLADVGQVIAKYDRCVSDRSFATARRFVSNARSLTFLTEQNLDSGLPGKCNTAARSNALHQLITQRLGATFEVITAAVNKPTLSKRVVEPPQSIGVVGVVAKIRRQRDLDGFIVTKEAFEQLR